MCSADEPNPNIETGRSGRVEECWERLEESLPPGHLALAAARDLALESFDLGFEARLDCSTGRYGMPSPAACVHHDGERVCRVATERARIAALPAVAVDGGA